MAAAAVMVGQRRQVGQEQPVNKVNASAKATTTTMTARTSMTKEMDRNLSTPGDAAQRNRTSNGGGGVLDN